MLRECLLNLRLKNINENIIQNTVQSDLVQDVSILKENSILCSKIKKKSNFYCCQKVKIGHYHHLCK